MTPLKLWHKQTNLCWDQESKHKWKYLDAFHATQNKYVASEIERNPAPPSPDSLTSLHRSSSWTTPARSRRVTPPCWTATPLTSPANSASSRRRLTVVPARSLRTTPRLSSPETLPSLPWCLENPCVLRASPSILLWVSFIFVINTVYLFSPSCSL